MICFPLDNTEYEAKALGAWCGTRTRGVFSDDTNFTVSSNGNMNVYVSEGLAWLKANTFWGVCVYEQYPQVLTLDVADKNLSRIDCVCVRLDKNRNLAEVVIKKGSYAQKPTITPPVRNNNYDEIYIATVYVRAGATHLVQSDITDQRLNEDYCGLMRDGVTKIPTDTLYRDWTEWFSDFEDTTEKCFEDYEDKVKLLYLNYSAYIALNRTNVNNDYNSYNDYILNHKTNANQVYNDYENYISNYETSAKDEYQEWLDSLRSPNWRDIPLNAQIAAVGGAGYYMDGLGFIHFKGSIVDADNRGITNTTFAYLPEECRPKNSIYLPSCSYNSAGTPDATIRINRDGSMMVAVSGTTLSTPVVLDGLSFWVGIDLYETPEGMLVASTYTGNGIGVVISGNEYDSNLTENTVLEDGDISIKVIEGEEK